MRPRWLVYWTVWVVIVTASVLGAWFSTRPKFDTLTNGVVTESHEVDDAQSFAFEQTIVFDTHTIAYGTRIPLHPGRSVWISYDSRNPSRYEIFDAGAFRHAVQLIFVGVVMMAGFSAAV